MREPTQYYLHSLTGEASEPRRNLLECMIQSGKYGLEDMGFLIHALGDAFAHSYYPSIKWHGKLVSNVETQYTPLLGHLFQGHTPDHISSDPQKYLNYVSALTQSLPLPPGIDDDVDPDLYLDRLGNLRDAVGKLHESGKTDDQISSDEYNSVIRLTDYDPNTIEGYNPNPQTGNESILPSFIKASAVIAEWHVLLRDIKQNIKSGKCCGK